MTIRQAKILLQIFEVGKPVFESFFPTTALDCCRGLGSLTRKFIYSIPGSRVLLIKMKIGKVIDFSIDIGYLSINVGVI